MRQKRLIVPEEANCSLHFSDSKATGTDRLTRTNSGHEISLTPNPNVVIAFPTIVSDRVAS